MITVYSMGKVGSISVFKALKRAGLVCQHAHHLEQEQGGKYICPIRDSVDRNISAFFENFRDYGCDYNDSVVEMRDKFIAQYPHIDHGLWFDNEIKWILGIDVYDEPFPPWGWQEYEGRLLVLKSELDDDLKSGLVSRFVGRDVTIGRENVRAEKQNAHPYKRFKDYGLYDWYENWMRNTRYAVHFGYNKG